jgi:hypothetical protein
MLLLQYIWFGKLEEKEAKLSKWKFAYQVPYLFISYKEEKILL